MRNAYITLLISLVFFHRPVLFLIIISLLPSFWICHNLSKNFPIDENLSCVIEWHIVLILYSPILILSIFCFVFCNVYWLNSDFGFVLVICFGKGYIGRPNANWGLRKLMCFGLALLCPLVPHKQQPRQPTCTYLWSEAKARCV